MGRPEYSSRPGTTSRGGLSSWIQRRKERKTEAAEAAAKLITNDTAKNEMAIINTLRSVDFLNSRIPKELLEKKDDPNRTCGDLEGASRIIAGMLLEHPQTLAIDIRKIDERLLTIAILFKQAVEHGDTRAAFAAKGALVRGVNDIRSRIPSNDPKLFAQFVEANSKYLDNWITLIGMARDADRIKENVEQHRHRVEEKRKAQQEKAEMVKGWIQNDSTPEGRIYASFTNHDTAEERSNWTPEQRDMHRFLVECRLGDVRLNIDELLLKRSELALATKNHQVDLLCSKVDEQVVVSDPELMNKFGEAVNEMFDSLAASDAELDETMRMMDDIEGRVKQLYAAPGSQRAAAVACEQAKKMLKDIEEQQQLVIDDNAGKMAEFRKRCNILTKEEEEILKRNAEIQRQRAEQEMRERVSEEVYEQQSEGEALYN